MNRRSVTPHLTRDRSWRLDGLAQSPVIAEGRVVCAFQSGEVRAFNSQATPLWRTVLPGKLDVGDWNGALRTAGAQLVTQFDRDMLTIDAASGAVLRRVPMPGSFEIRRAAIVGETIYVPSVAGDPGRAVTHTLQARRLPSLDKLWSRVVGDSLDELQGDARVLCATSARRRAVIAFAPSTGEEQWRLSLEDIGRGFVQALGREEPGRAVTVPHVLSASIVLGVYQHRVVGVDRNNGAVRWQTRVPMPTPLNCEPGPDEHLMCISSRAFIELDTVSGRIVRDLRLTDAPPGTGVNPGTLAISAGLVFAVESDGVVFAFDPEKGEVIWHDQVGAKVPLSLPPVVTNGRLFVTDRRGRLRVFTISRDAIDGTP